MQTQYAKRHPHHASALLTLVLSACSEGEHSDESIGQRASAINSEIAGQADIAGAVRMAHPDRQLASYAMVMRANNCSGTMIGPNMMLTAAHCGETTNTTVTFFSYADPTPGNYRARFTEIFNCSRVAATFPETDLSLWWCDANAVGQNPGDKYGYLDFDLVYDANNQIDVVRSSEQAFVGREVYSFWWNRVGTDGNTDHLIYSSGSIAATNTSVWSNPTPIDTSQTDMDQCQSDDDTSLGHMADVYSNPGCSGSSLVSLGDGFAGRRILVAPISTSAGEARDRTGQAILTVLRQSVLQTPNSTACPSGPVSSQSAMVGSYVSSRGLISQNFAGRVDANNNGVFDLQEALERVEREHRRPAYWFGFDSQRKNLVWDALAGVIRTQDRQLFMNAGASGWTVQAVHSRLNLSPNTNYHVEFTLASDRQAAVCLDGNCTIVGPTGSTSVFTRFTSVLSSGATGVLRVWTNGGGISSVGEISLVQMNSAANFDTADGRSLWTSSTSRWPTTTPLFLPLGRTSVDADFAGDMAVVVPRGNNTLASTHLPFGVGTTRVCFDMRSNPLNATLTGLGRVLVADNQQTTAVNHGFSLTSDWNRVCTPWFNMATTLGRITFGLDPSGTAQGSYLVDEIQLDRLDAPSMRFSHDGPETGMTCTRIAESADTAGTWLDNYLCADRDLGLAWSSAGPIAGMVCTQIVESAEPSSTTWTDNYLCLPQGTALSMSWSSAGPIAGKVCVQWREPSDPHTWNDNFLCY